MREPISIMVLTQLLACCTEMKIEPGPFNPAVGNFELCVSLATLDELRKVLHRRKFDRYTPLPERLDFLDLMAQQSLLWQVDLPSEVAVNNACRDAKDAKFLELALSCQATALVSSDADLLVLHPWHGIPILTPSAFLQANTP
jgi:putative PIN family toxin of toxin-antitoxin system